MALIDFDDIQAAENRRREVAVKAGASPRDTKYEPSIYKDMIVEYVKEAEPSVSNEFTDLQKEVALPGYNFGATLEDAAKLTESKEGERGRSAEEEAEEFTRLQEESKENEMKVTRTGTGQPKVDENGNVVEPLQPMVPTPTLGSSKSTNVSAAGSGDARAAANVQGGSTSSGSTPPAKK